MEKQIDDVLNDLNIYNKSDDSPIYGNIENIINILKKEMLNCKDNQNAEKSIQRADTFRKLFERLTNVCDGIHNLNQSDTNKSDPNLENRLQLLSKLSQEETSYTSKLLCAQRVRI